MAENMNNYVMHVLIRSMSNAFLQIKDYSVKIKVGDEAGLRMEKNSELQWNESK